MASANEGYPSDLNEFAWGTGEDLKEKGTAAAVDAKKEWATRAKAAALQLGKGGRFTSEDVTAIVGFPTNTSGTNANNAVGGVFAQLVKKGLIVKVGYTNAKNVTGHARTLAQWSLTPEGESAGAE